MNRFSELTILKLIDTYLKNLSETLLNGYNADIVPILDENSPLEVKLDFTISQILEVVRNIFKN